jgi:autotransporter-associated beta strand protein
VTKSGTGTWTLSGTNTYGGPTTISAGKLKLGHQHAVTNSTVTMAGGSLLFNSSVTANAFTFGGLAAASAGAGYDIGLTNDLGTAVALTVGGNNASTTNAGVLSGGGSLTKVGSANLTLSGTNTYTGATTVNGGTLVITIAATIATNSTVTVTNGAILNLGFATTNRVGALVLNGVSQPNGVYGASTPGGYLAGTGKLQVASQTIVNYPTNITFSVTVNTLNLSWPATHLGWLVQSNSVNLAVTNYWFDIAGTGAGTNYSITIDSAKTNVFYRLRSP